MQTLSLLQPFASLLAHGKKRIETRSWRPPASLIGQVLAIHASARFPRECIELCFQMPFRAALVACGYTTPGELPRGAVIGTATLVECRSTSAGPNEPTARWVNKLDADEEEFGDYSPGRFGWFFAEFAPFEAPVPARGALGIWRWEAAPTDDALTLELT